MSWQNRIIVITGPTATGKSALGALLAKALNGEVVSADSMQIYKYMDIGTAKPTAAEKLGIPHHMLDVVPPGEDYSVSRYVHDASRCLDDIVARGKVPVVVGGTGLYIDSLAAGRSFSQRGGGQLRKGLEERYRQSGGEAMLRELGRFDRERAAKLHANDMKRIVRAFEIYELTGMTISQHDRETQASPDRYVSSRFALTFADRQTLYDRIENRVGRMMEAGLAQEVQSLLDMGVPPDCTSMQAIGYKEIAGAIKGEFSYETAVETIKSRSRHYAKRQLTWLRRKEGVHWIEWEVEPDPDMAVELISQHFFG